MSSCWPCFKYRYTTACIGLMIWPEVNSQALLALYGSASPQGSQSSPTERQHRFFLLAPHQPVYSIPSPQDLPWALLPPRSCWAKSTELCELGESGNFCPGASFCLRCKPRDPRSLRSSILLLDLSKKYFTKCLREGGWPRNKTPVLQPHTSVLGSLLA